MRSASPPFNNGRMSTKTDHELAEKELLYQDDPERAEVIACARRFKSSWIELGRVLTETRKNGRWRSWGYETFEAYAKNELKLRQDTVDKLTGSFMFLKSKAPDLLRDDNLSAPIPSYQAIDFLRRAEEKQGASHEDVKEIRRQVLEEGTPLPTIARQFKDKVFPLDHKERKERDAAGIKNVAKRLRELLADTRAVKKATSARVTEALDELLAEVGAEEEAA